MAFKAILLCASVLLFKTISGQCIGSAFNSGLGNGIHGFAGNGLINNVNIGNGYSGCGAGLNGFNNGLAIQSSGGPLGVSSASPIFPNGISIASENAIEGALAVSGALPFLATMGFEGQVPSGGSAGVSYNCGNGNVGIISENGAGFGYGAGVGIGYGAGINGFGCRAGLNNYGLGNIGLAGGYGTRGCSCGSF